MCARVCPCVMVCELPQLGTLFFIIQKSSNKVYNFGNGSKVLLSIISFTWCLCVLPGWRSEADQGQTKAHWNCAQFVSEVNLSFLFREWRGWCKMHRHWQSVKRKSARKKGRKHSNLSKSVLSVSCVGRDARPRLAQVPKSAKIVLNLTFVSRRKIRGHTLQV